MIFLLAALAVAQVPSAIIFGTVVDPSGAVVPKAVVTATQMETSWKTKQETAGDGTFRLAGLDPGEYRIDVVASGFLQKAARHVQLEVRQAVEITIPLYLPGTMVDFFEVRSTPVEAASEPEGFNVDHEQIARLPLPQRDIAGLMTFGPGVVPRQLSGFNGDVVTGVEPSRGNVSENHPVNGARSTMNTYLLDGVLNTDGNVRTVVVNPPVDAISDFRLQTSVSSADFGYSGGGVANVVTASGTKDFHADLYDYFRNEVLDARSYFDSGSAHKAAFRQNQFGGSAGGRVPKFPRLFFFAAYEGLQLNKGQSKGSAVPTDAQRAGNFSSVVIKDPQTGKPFANNVIPLTRIDPIARAVIDQYQPRANQGGAQNYLSTTPILNGDDSIVGRVDWRPDARGSVFVRYAINDERADQGNGRLVEPTHQRVRAQNAAIGHTYTGSGDWVNEFRVGWNRLKIQDLSVNAFGADIVGQLGINGIDRDPVNYGLPTFILTSNQLIASDDPSLPIAQAGQTYQALDNWSTRRGRHTIQLGAEVRRFSMAYQQRMNSRGNFTFTGAYSGDPLADFLLGFPQSTQRTVGQPQAYLRQSGYALYAQDEFRVTNNLIVTYGLRYEYNSPFSEKYNNMYNLDYSTLPKVPALVREGTSSSNVPVDLVATNRKDFAPRLGIAWHPLPSRNLIFRSAYGLFYNPEIAREAYDLVLNGVRTETDTAGATPVLTLKNPFVSSTSNGFPTYYGIDTHAATPYVQQWNAGWQYGTHGFLFEAAYIGSKGTHLGRFDKFNTPQHVETGENLGPRPGDIQSLRTFPQLGPFIQRKDIANSSYNALQLRLEHRFSRGLELQASYTWSKSIDDADGVIPGLFDSVGAQDERNLRAERGLSFSDVPRRFATNFSYDLPLGRSFVARGWSVSGTITLQDGTRENAFYFFADPANTDTPNRPNIVAGQSAGLPKSQQTPGHFFNTAAFSMPAPYTFGNAGRDLLPTPGVEIVNLAVNRRFTITEHSALNLRAEFFNAFNHPNFGIPINNPDFGPAFGVIAVTGDPRLVQLSLRLAF